jgi:LPS export ABC transporter protein LptC
MPPSPSKQKRRLKYLLLSVIFIIGALIVGTFLLSRVKLDGKAALSVTIQDEANVIIENIQQSSIRDGKKEWSLKADQAQLFKAKNQAVLYGLNVTFFLENNDEVYLTAKEGVLNTETKDIQVFGNVVIQNDKAKLETEKLNYDHKRRIFISKERVKISGDGSELTADSLIFYISTKRAILEGNVDGLFSEGFALF